MDGQSADWSNMEGIQATGKDCWRGNLRTFFCQVSFTGTYTDTVYNISQDMQAYAVVRMYLLANDSDLYRQLGDASLVTTSTPYTSDIARKHHPGRWQTRCLVKRCDVPRAASARAGSVR